MIDIKVKKCLCRKNSIGFFHTCYDCGSMINFLDDHFYIIGDQFKGLYVCGDCKEKENG